MQRKVPKWEIYENKFVVHKTYSNAFKDVFFSVLFVHRSKNYLVNGFYDGEEGAIVSGFSTKSVDEKDIFTDPYKDNYAYLSKQ